jgi:hypothetical protein
LLRPTATRSDGKIGWDRRQIIDRYLGTHPALAEHIQWHIKKGTRTSVVRGLRPLRLDQSRCFNIPDAPPASAADAHRAETNRPGIAEWLAVWKLSHPQSSEDEELTSAQMKVLRATESAAFEGRRMEPRCRQAGSVAKKQRRRRSKIRQFAAELAN